MKIAHGSYLILSDVVFLFYFQPAHRGPLLFSCTAPHSPQSVLWSHHLWRNWFPRSLQVPETGCVLTYVEISSWKIQVVGFFFYTFTLSRATTGIYSETIPIKRPTSFSLFQKSLIGCSIHLYLTSVYFPFFLIYIYI